MFNRHPEVRPQKRVAKHGPQIRSPRLILRDGPLALFRMRAVCLAPRGCPFSWRAETKKARRERRAFPVWRVFTHSGSRLRVRFRIGLRRMAGRTIRRGRNGEGGKRGQGQHRSENFLHGFTSDSVSVNPERECRRKRPAGKRQIGRADGFVISNERGPAMRPGPLRFLRVSNPRRKLLSEQTARSRRMSKAAPCCPAWQRAAP